MMRATSRMLSFSETHCGFGVITSRTWRVSLAIAFLLQTEERQSNVRARVERRPLRPPNHERASEGQAQAAGQREIAGRKRTAGHVIRRFHDSPIFTRDREIGVQSELESVIAVRVEVIFIG